VMEVALEAGAADLRTEPEGYEVLTEPARFEAVHTALEQRGIKCAAAAVTNLPSLTVPLSGTAAGDVQRLLDALEEHDDVKDVYSNAELNA